MDSRAPVAQNGACSSVTRTSGVRAGDVFREHPGSEPLAGIVRTRNDLVLAVELEHAHHWAEDLFTHDRHVVAALIEQRRRDEVAAGQLYGSLPADDEAGA
jgi:hypothetical protein